jgi:uncharacterized protein YggE
MKKSIALVAILLSGMIAFAQTVEKQTPYIEVVGSAEMEVEPDEIHLEVTIAEYSYTKPQKIGSDKKVSVSINKAETTLMDILKKEGIKKDQIFLKNTSKGYYYADWNGYKDYDVKMQKKYEIVFTGFAQLDRTLKALPSADEGITNITITSTKNNNIEQYRKQVKIQAMKAAKDKAQYLLESIGNQVGNPVSIIEIDNDGGYTPYFRSNVMMAKAGGVEDAAEEPNAQMQKIKLKYQIRAQFEIK